MAPSEQSHHHPPDAPLPALLPNAWDGQDWRVEAVDNVADAATGERHLLVPRTATGTVSPQSQAVDWDYHRELVRQHELAHAIRSQEVGGVVDPSKTPRGMLRRALDEVVVELRHPVDIREAHDQMDLRYLNRPGNSLVSAVKVLQFIHAVETHGTRSKYVREIYTNALETLQPAEREAVLGAYDGLTTDSSPANCDRIADYLATLFPEDKNRPGASNHYETTCSMATAYQGGDSQPAPGASRPGTGTPTPAPRYRPEDSWSERETFSDPKWGQVLVGGRGAVREGAHQPLWLNLHGHPPVRRPPTSKSLSPSTLRPIDDGLIVRYPHLLEPSGRVFSTHHRGGTIIVDHSGSMHWHFGALQAVLPRIPRLWVGVYSGVSDGGTYSESNGCAGQLCLLSQNGRLGTWTPQCASHVHHPTDDRQRWALGNNGCDAMVLDYIARHAPRPYVWVTDGEVCGPLTHYQMCDDLMTKHHIPMVQNIEDALAYLNGKPVLGWRRLPKIAPRGAVFIRRT